ncbi:MAG: 1-acyl-sn-glycerol-3-phosphate acyltransferase [Planctomycetota bacterium]
MSIILDRPYEFVPRDRGNFWPSLIQRFRLIDWHLKRREGVVGYEIRHAERLRQSIDAGDGVLLTPNHCRYADPIVLGWLARKVHTHVYAMASWHLFNTNAFERFALRRMGGFSVYREGNDRQALETSVEVLVHAERPLILFPEGTTNRTNDRIKPLAEGVTFVARTAARRREKQDGGQVVVHPVAIKYVSVDDPRSWIDEQLTDLERSLSWFNGVQANAPEYGPVHASNDRERMARLGRIAEAFLALKEIQYLGTTQAGALPLRRDCLIRQIVHVCEQRYVEAPTEASQEPTMSEPVRHGPMIERIRTCRTAISNTYFDRLNQDAPLDREAVQADVAAIELAQFLLSFADDYVSPEHVTDMRVVETVQRIQEAVYGKANDHLPTRAIIEVDDAMVVPPTRAPRGETDPLLLHIDSRLKGMMGGLARLAGPFEIGDEGGQEPRPDLSGDAKQESCSVAPDTVIS